ncbi:ABC transporter permease [Pseudonocardia sp. K10HN5]|uniref:ABC transporter permease n=2 Tax=Pseudonocardia acidicola TaxID=2724939 RepID=A0ABX1S5G3_9PSEU|nr:ABC transporter permease [Pseudonocardia acidicola]NMH96820.1 ABC transporter permease [Pseudonocardia acidicola]
MPTEESAHPVAGALSTAGGQARPPTPRRTGALWRGRASTWTGVVAAVALWELLPRLGILPAEYIPPASVVLPTLVGLFGDGAFWSDLGATLAGWVIGLSLSTVVAVPLGLLIGTTPALHRATRVLIEFFRPIPSVALIPLAILVFGITLDMKVFLIVFATFWPILVQSVYGVQDVDPVARDSARSFGLNRREIFFHITLPSAAPYVVTGLRLASALAIVLAVTGELVAGAPGLGRSILVAQSAGASDLMYALIVVTGLVSLLLSAALSAVERTLLHWHQSHRVVQS